MPSAAPITGPSAASRRTAVAAYRHRDFDTRTGTIDVAVPTLRQGTSFPEWLLQRRRRAEQAMISVVAASYPPGVSTRRMEGLVAQSGITSLSESQVSEMAASLDEQVRALRTRPLDNGPYRFIAAGVNNEGYREVLGLHVASVEDGAGWLAFRRDLAARGLNGVKLVTSDAHAGLVAAIGATTGAAWQRCRTRYAANLMTITPKSSWPWVKTLLHTIYDQASA